MRRLLIAVALSAASACMAFASAARAATERIAEITAAIGRFILASVSRPLPRFRLPSIVNFLNPLTPAYSGPSAGVMHEADRPRIAAARSV